MTRIRGKCIDCGVKLPSKSEYCRKCAGIKRRIHEDPDLYRREWHLRKKYGMEFGEFDVWWMACRGKCFLCRKNMKQPEMRRGQSLDVVAVDHDHKTGKVRGLLCNSCNKGLGLFNDDVELLRRAINYLGDSNG